MGTKRGKAQPAENSASRSGSGGYALLNDLPVDRPDEDLLGMRDTATGIARMLIASSGASPFVVAIDAGWGMGKSTLLRQIEAQLTRHNSRSDRIRTVWFNAWTAEGGDALEGLIKSVLEELDRNIVRRWVRKAAQRGRVLSLAGIGLAIAGRFLGISRLVDELWKQLSLDAQSRNRLREDIGGMLSDWTRSSGGSGPRRCMVVFIDDLDRCSDEVVVKVCEAVKLYLDAPGLIFVLACDQSVMARGVATSARGGADEGRSYLEKIVQVAYRVPPPDDDTIRGLIRGYAKRSRTQSLITDEVETTLAEGTGRNPRKIKRIINSFILEYQLSPAWHKKPLSTRHLITAILLQHLYSPFYDLLVRDQSHPDPVGELLGYAEIRERVSMDGGEDSLGPYVQFFRSHGIEMQGDGSAAATAAEAFKRLEQRLPQNFPALADNAALLALLRGLGDGTARQALHVQLFHRPLATKSPPQLPTQLFDYVPPSRLSGLRIASVFSTDEFEAYFADSVTSPLRALGASVDDYTDETQAEQEILLQRPDAVISVLSSVRDPRATLGFTVARKVRAAGYSGRIVFLTPHVDRELRQGANEIDAIITTPPKLISVISPD